MKVIVLLTVCSHLVIQSKAFTFDISVMCSLKMQLELRKSREVELVRTQWACHGRHEGEVIRTHMKVQESCSCVV